MEPFTDARKHTPVISTPRTLRAPARAQATPIPYMRQLDGLRAIAVSLVFLEHWVPERSALHVIPAGMLGVHLFFVLSGFLITSILLRVRTVPSGRLRQLWVFYGRRFLRIFPAYYALLLALFVLDVPPVRQTIGWHAAYLSNFYFATRGAWQGRISHFWSLAAEEQFYVCVPWLFIFLPSSLLSVVIGLVLFAGLFGRLLLFHLGFGPMAISILPVSSCDTLGFGAFLAWSAWRGRDGHSRRQQTALAALGVLGLAGICFLRLVALAGDGRPLALFGPTALALFCGWIVARTARGFGGALGGILGSAPVVYIGKISYGLYLFHVFASPAYAWLYHSLHFPSIVGFWWFRLPLFFAITLAAASLSWRFFEKPLLDLKRLLPYDAKGDAR